MTQFDVDVVIPLYNKKDKVIRCLKSVVLQTKLPNKIIVVDDGSEDGSTDIVSEFCFSGRDKKGLIKFVSQENRGVSAARNLGVSLSAARYIAFLDADDYWEPTFLEKMEQLISTTPRSVFWSSGHKEIRSEFEIRNYDFSNFSNYIENYAECALNAPLVNSSKVIVRRDTLVNIGGFEESAKVAEDLYMWLRLSLDGPLGFINDSLVMIDKTPSTHRAVRTVNYLPYPVIALCCNKKFSQRIGYSEKKYIFKVAIIHGVFAKLHSDSRILRESSYYIKEVMPFRSLLLNVLSLLPSQVFKLIYSAKSVLSKRASVRH